MKSLRERDPPPKEGSETGFTPNIALYWARMGANKEPLVLRSREAKRLEL
jgi:hypothetical protein